MQTMLLPILFMYGAVFGSFFNVVGIRVPKQSLFEERRSHCNQCQRILGWSELVPIWSYVFQSGRCKECKSKISLLYPIVEILTGFLFAFSYYKFGWTLSFLLAILLISLIVPVTVSDLLYQKIPNHILLFFTPLFILYRIINPLIPVWNSLVGGLFAFLLSFLIILLSKGGMGVGDLKYYTLFGFVFGLSNFLLLFFLSTIYGVIAGISIMKVKKTGPKTKFAFGPYIGLAALTVLYFGDVIIHWYMQLLS